MNYLFYLSTKMSELKKIQEPPDLLTKPVNESNQHFDLRFFRILRQHCRECRENIILRPEIYRFLNEIEFARDWECLQTIVQLYFQNRPPELQENIQEFLLRAYISSCKVQRVFKRKPSNRSGLLLSVDDP